MVDTRERKSRRNSSNLFSRRTDNDCGRDQQGFCLFNQFSSQWSVFKNIKLIKLKCFFVLGRSVLLEIQRKGSNKMHTHMLSAHGGHIFIHSLQAFEKSAICEEPPSISESSGGRITDYRIAV